MMSKKLEPLPLSKTELKDLQREYKQERDRRIAERIHCVILYAQGNDLKAVRKLLFVGIKTLKKWVKIFVAEGLAGLRQWATRARSAS
jgi:transposase